MYIGYFIIKHFIAHYVEFNVLWTSVGPHYRRLYRESSSRTGCNPLCRPQTPLLLTFIQVTPAAVATEYSKSTLVDTSSNSPNINFD